MDVLGQIRQSIREHQLISHGETVIVGVSGGPDSLCLLHALIALRDEFRFTIHVAHLNHQLRGSDADADAQFVSDLAARWELPCTVEARDVTALARERKLSIEEAAREARYAFLAGVAIAHNSRTVAVAHNADDQAESVLMHLLRGSGTAGLRGMLPKSEMPDLRMRISDSPFALRPSALRLIRPLLAIPRSDIERYCAEHNLQPRFDASNLDTTFFRNRLRHDLLPLLETYNPNIRQALRRTADVIAAEVEVLHAATEAAWRTALVSEANGAIAFSLAAWRGLPLAMRRAVLRTAVHRLRPSLRNINFVHIDDAVTGLQSARTGARLTLPQHLILHVDYETFTVADAGRDLDWPDWPLLPDRATTLHCIIQIPGITPLPGSGWQLEASRLEAWGDAVFNNPDRWTAYLDADTTGSALSIRVRAPGEVFHPQGMPSPIRLTNWMTNAKVPRAVRDRLPLIVAGDRIAWVAGFRIGQAFSVTLATRLVLKLSLQHRDSPGFDEN